ncbi:MAG: hypothetical protein LBI34_00435 [Puniceicoccales bacterium]|jgi:hypothetical protein|nr:hypothetical protein [Puniceicoccales bacterium]
MNRTVPTRAFATVDQYGQFIENVKREGANAHEWFSKCGCSELEKTLGYNRRVFWNQGYDERLLSLVHGYSEYCELDDTTNMNKALENIIGVFRTLNRMSLSAGSN